MILGDFGDLLSTIFASAAGNEMVVSRNLPVAELNWFCFLLTLVYLNSEEFDCKGEGDWTEGFLSQIKTLLPGVILEMLNSIEEFLFQCWKIKSRAGAGESRLYAVKD